MTSIHRCMLCWRVYKLTAPPGQRDRQFLSSVFQKLLINFTWWVNRKDARQAPVLRRFLGAGQYRCFRPLAPAAQRWPVGTGRWHRLDGILLCDDARDGPRTVPLGSGRGGYCLEVLRALRAYRRRHEHAGGHGVVERRRQLLLRPDVCRRRAHAVGRCARWGPDSAVCGRSSNRRSDERVARIPEAIGLVSDVSPRPGEAYFLHGNQ